MSISEPFIRRPVATTLLMIGLLLAGIAAYRQLPVAALPQVDYPTIVVTTQLPGASAETMASAVTTPLERQFGQVPSLTQMTSVSSFGSSQITLQFALDRDIDAAEQDVQAAINAATNLLPRTLPAPPTYSKSNPADQPVLTLSVTSETLTLAQISDFADSVLAQKLSQVSGVGLVTMGGGQKPAVRVQVDPVALAGTGLTLEDVRQAIATANVNQPKGNLDGPRQDWALATNDQLTSAAGFKPLVIAYKNGAPIRLQDVSDVVDGVENDQLAGWSGKRRAVIINVQRQPGANIIDVTDHVKALLPQLRASMPQAMDVKILSDRTETIRASVHDVKFTLVLTIALVVAVIYLFLGSARATLIPGVAVPLSLIGTFGLMKLFGTLGWMQFSLDNLSLMALTISTGFVVDDAIVMVENISRFIEGGMRPFEAALAGAKQIGFTIVSLTVSLVAVLIPLLFMTGLVGRLFREFAVTLAMSIAISAVLSLTLTAMMCAWILKPHVEEHPNVVARAFERGFAAMTRFYDRTLQVVLRHKTTTLLVTLGTVAATVLLAMHVPKGFFPVQDTGLVTGVSEAAPDVSFSKMMELQQQAADVILTDPAVASVSSFIGADGVNATTNSGRFSISLVPREARDASVTEIIDRLEPKLATLAGIRVYLQPVQDLTVDARLSRTPYQYTVEDPDPKELGVWAPRLLGAMKALPQLRDVASDQEDAGREIHLDVDRDTASRLGISAQAIDDTLYDAFGQRIVSTTFTQLNQYRVILEVDPKARQAPDALDKLYVRGSAGAVPLSSFVRTEPRQAPLAIDHEGQFPSVTLSFDTAPGVSLGEAVSAIDTASAHLDMPTALRGRFTGAAQVFRDSLASEPILILAALITVYIVLGVLYESYVHPITILSTLPSAGVGAILALYVCGKPFDVIGLIGIILLIGIVKKNAIMMIDFALEAERDQHLPPHQAIYQACLMRFRPIMMTTAAALLGALPLALSFGEGGEVRRPLGIAIVGGL
ncbi:MAG: multidrug efflux RND transporter permease subunit, partial [Kofleriaceae bacterium]